MMITMTPTIAMNNNNSNRTHPLLATEDVIGFYDRFQELSTSHLLALMPFDSIVLKNRYEGLFIPGLGTQQFADCSRAMMDLLPRLIPGTL